MAEERKTALLRQTQLLRQTKRGEIQGESAPAISFVNSCLEGQKGSYVVESTFSTSGGESDLYLCTKDSITFIAKIYRLQPENVLPEKRKQLLSFLMGVSEDSYVMPVIDHGIIHERIFDILPFYPDGDLSTHGRFTYSQLVDFIIPALNAGLYEIHQNGLIHRDLKPSNLYIDQNRRLKIGDFGIASIANKNLDVLTVGGAGTLGYRAPEVGLGTAGSYSDYFSLGITLASLYKGAELFENMSEFQIGNMITNKNLPVYIAETRLMDLINGLITMDKEWRFGYQEVLQWCRGEDVQSREKPALQSWSKSYRFNGEDFYEPVSFSQSLAENWDRARDHLYRGLIPDYFRSEDQDLSVIANNIVEREFKNDRDSGLFRFLYYMNNKLPLYWKGIMYKDLTDIADRINADIGTVRQDIVTLFSSRALSWRLKQNKSVTEGHQAELEAIKNIQTLADNGNSEVGYYLFMYQFMSPEKERVFRFNNQVVSDIDSLFHALIADTNSFYQACREFVSNNLFFAFLSYLGYQDASILLKTSLTNSVLDNAGKILSFFDSYVTDKTAVSKFYCMYGPLGHLYWLKHNLNLYSFNGSEAQNLKREIEELEISDQLPLSELSLKFFTLAEYSHQFLQMFHNNINFSVAGIYENKDKKGITARAITAFFHYDYYGQIAPIGFEGFVKSN